MARSRACGSDARPDQDQARLIARCPTERKINRRTTQPSQRLPLHSLCTSACRRTHTHTRTHLIGSQPDSTRPDQTSPESDLVQHSVPASGRSLSGRSNGSCWRNQLLADESLKRRGITEPKANKRRARFHPQRRIHRQAAGPMRSLIACMMSATRGVGEPFDYFCQRAVCALRGRPANAFGMLQAVATAQK